MAGAKEKLEQIVEPAVEALDCELLGIEYVSQGRHSLIRIYIDKPEGVNVDDCARVSRQISAVLDVEDPIPGQYTLEVSSPGVERPLFKAEHFAKYVGETIQVRLTAPLQGRRKFKGILLGIDDDGVVRMEFEGNELSFELDEIEKAHLVAEW